MINTFNRLTKFVVRRKWIFGSVTGMAILVLLSGCVQKVDRNIERGATYKFKEGFPEARVSAIGIFDALGEPGITVTTDIVYGSLIYKTEGNQQIANVILNIRIEDKETKKNIESELYSLDITAKKKNITNSQDIFTYKKWISVPPGDYTVYVTTIDKNSDKEITRQTQAFIPNPEKDIANLTTIQLLSKDLNSGEYNFLPVTTYDVPGKVDSLKFRFQVTNTKNDTLEILSKLKKFKADTTISRRMSSNDYSAASLPYDGIEYDEFEIIQENRRVILQPGNVLIEFKFPQLSRGNYRFEVSIGGSIDESEEVKKARDFSVKSKNYPTLKTPRELAKPLAYLMGRKEYEKMMQIKSPDSLKKAVDKFWLQEIKQPQTAQDVIALYYERVEMANKQFSNFKEGWKTDPGRVFILFGPPWYVDQNIETMQWSYSYNRQDPNANFIFLRPKINNKYYPFNHFILDRRQFYFGNEYRQTQNWITGRILTRSLSF